MTLQLEFFEVSIAFVYFAKVPIYVNYLVFKRPRFYDMSSSMIEKFRKRSLEPSGASSVANSATMTSKRKDTEDFL